MTIPAATSPHARTAGEVVIRHMTERDWPSVREIFTAGIESGHATFEAKAPEWEQFDASLLEEHRFVAEVNGAVLGWAAVSAVSPKTKPAFDSTRPRDL